MTPCRRVLPALAAAARVAPVVDQTTFTSLFNGTSLAGWTMVGKVENGVQSAAWRATPDEDQHYTYAD